jgi:hypothetical protein
MSERWITCARCPEDDNEWPASAFNASGSAYGYQTFVCNACFEEEYERLRGECSVCGKYAETKRRRGAPRRPLRHRKCEVPILTFEYLESQC